VNNLNIKKRFKRILKRKIPQIKEKIPLIKKIENQEEKDKIDLNLTGIESSLLLKLQLQKLLKRF
jgi:hypothetical protein